VFIRLSEAVRRSAGDGKAPHTYERPEIQVFNASNGALLKRFAIVRDGRLGTGVRITSGLIVSRDGRAAYLAVRDFEGLSGLPPRIAIERIDLNSGAVAALFEHRQPDEFTALAVNSDQSLVATGEAVGNKQGWRGPDGAWVTHETTDPVRLWNARDGSPHADLGPSAGAVRRLLFLPDGSRVIACQTDNQSHNLMAIWDPKAKVLAAVVRVVTPRPVDVSCALSQDGRHAILTVPTDGPSGASMPEKAYMVDPLSTAR
jgi:WD40 repeat protein